MRGQKGSWSERYPAIIPGFMHVKRNMID
jgi:hypothetical protein